MNVNPLISEWTKKAEGDWRSAMREYRARLDPNYDASCFHAQQCAEKYIKALLQSANIPFPKTHNLSELLDLLPRPRADWEMQRTNLEALSVNAVEIRYPGVTAGKAEAKIALATCRTARPAIWRVSSWGLRPQNKNAPTRRVRRGVLSLLGRT